MNNTGGLTGFDNVLWKVREQRSGRKPSIKFTYHSFDGEQGKCHHNINNNTDDVVGCRLVRVYHNQFPTTQTLEIELIMWWILINAA